MRATSHCRLPLDHLQPHPLDGRHELLLDSPSDLSLVTDWTDLSDVQGREPGTADSVVMFPQ